MHCVICVGEGAGTTEELNGLKRSSAAVKQSLSELGITSTICVIKGIIKHIPKCDFVFNLCDNDEGYFDSYISFTTFLEQNNILYTGNTSTCFKNCANKLRWSDHLLLKKYLPLRSDKIHNLTLPCIIKHRYNHGSLYPVQVIEDNTSALPLLDNAEYFLEEFIKGEELCVSYLQGHKPRIGIRDLKHEEILDFQTKWSGKIGIKRYDLKEEGYNYIVQMIDNIKNVLDVNSYMRLDLRLNTNGTLYLIDINPNCSLDPCGSFSEIFSQYKIDYTSIIKSIVIDLLFSK